MADYSRSPRSSQYHLSSNTAQNKAFGNLHSKEIPDISGNPDVNSLLTDTEVTLCVLAETSDNKQLLSVLKRVKVCNFKTYPKYVSTPQECIDNETFFKSGVKLKFKIEFDDYRRTIKTSVKYIMSDRTIVVKRTGIDSIIDNNTKKVSKKFSKISTACQSRLEKLQKILIDLEEQYEKL